VGGQGTWSHRAYSERTLAARLPLLVLAVVAASISTAFAAIVGGNAEGRALFLGSGLLAGLFVAWLIARKTSDPLALVGGALLVTFVSFLAPVLVIYVGFAIADAGD
jgi:uncharacterized protein YacL